MFENDHSAARGKMAVRELIVFKHSKELGDCPAYKLFDAVEVRKKEEIEYPRKYQDYTVQIHEEMITDDPSVKEKRKETLLVRALPVSSKELGVSGECDLVEFHKCEDGITLSGHRGLYSVFPVEYKKGKPKITDEDKLQLTAQAMCLEEMFSTTISEGALYYGETRRRENITFSQELRDEVKEIFQEMHQYYERGYTPKVKKSKACNSCSLKEICLPKLEKTISVSDYIAQALKEDEQ